MISNNIIEDLDSAIFNKLEGKPLMAAQNLIHSKYINDFQEMANIVSKIRLKINDHGRVHMRKVTLYSIQIARLLKENGIQLSAEEENWGAFEDSLVSIIISAFLHDIGMAINRQRHEFFALVLVGNFIDELLDELYGKPSSLLKVGLKSMIVEAISGHMGTQKVSSREAGILLIADGCDLEYGRARKGSFKLVNGRVGDIHQYSAAAISKVEIVQGVEKPISINVYMDESAGFFQVEEVLMYKLLRSPLKDFVELYTVFEEKNMRKKYS